MTTSTTAKTTLIASTFKKRRKNSTSCGHPLYSSPHSEKTNFTQRTVKQRTKRFGFWCLSLPSPFFRSSITVLQGACCVPGLSTPRDWPVRVQGKSKRPSDNWFIKSVWGVEQEPRGCFADVTYCDKITSATQATIRNFKIQQRDGNENVAQNHYPPTLSNVGEPSGSWIPRDHNHVQKQIKFRLLVQSCLLLIKPI